MEKDCFEISFKEGCDKPVHFENDDRYVFNMESWIFYPTTKKIASESYYSYASKNDEGLFKFNISFIIDIVMKKKIYQNIICILFNDDELTSNIIEQIKLFTNNIDFVQFKDIKNSIDLINNKTIVLLNTRYRFNFLTSDDIDNIAGIKNKNIFSIFVVNTGNDINEMICRNKIIDKQPDNEIWYKTDDASPVTLCLDAYDGDDYIISNEYNGDYGVIKYKCDYIEKNRG